MNENKLYLIKLDPSYKVRGNYELAISGPVKHIEDHKIGEYKPGPSRLLLPNMYFEETIRRAIIYIAKLGVVTYEGIKAKKYQNALIIYRRSDDEQHEKELTRSRPCIQIKPFQYP